MPCGGRFCDGTTCPHHCDGRTHHSNCYSPYEIYNSHWMTPFGGHHHHTSPWMSPCDMEPAYQTSYPEYHYFNTELNYQPGRPANMIESYSLNNPVQIDCQGNGKLSCQLDLRSFQPDEINVVLDSKNRCINVEASHEMGDEIKNCVKRQYLRKIKIPNDVQGDLSNFEIFSKLTNDGILIIEVPLPRLSMEQVQKYRPTSFNTVCKVATKII